MVERAFGAVFEVLSERGSGVKRNSIEGKFSRINHAEHVGFVGQTSS